MPTLFTYGAKTRQQFIFWAELCSLSWIVWAIVIEKWCRKQIHYRSRNSVSVVFDMYFVTITNIILRRFYVSNKDYISWCGINWLIWKYVQIPRRQMNKCCTEQSFTKVPKYLSILTYMCSNTSEEIVGTFTSNS